MIQRFIQQLRGDRVIWALVFLLALISFMPVYSACTNLVYFSHKVTIAGSIMKHFVHLFIGLSMMYFVHKMPYHYFRGVSKYGIYIMIGLLGYTLTKGTVIGGATASRWIEIPYVGISFQTSTIAMLMVMIYTARYLAKVAGTTFTFKESLLDFWLPVFGVVGLILPTNFSTAALVFGMVCMLMFVGQYPLKYLAYVFGLGIVGLVMFFMIGKNIPNDALQRKLQTWENRITNYANTNANEDEQYQVEKAKVAIASGNLYGLGPGKSIQKNFLPQSTSDFIYAIIVEEYGFIGGVGVLCIYLLLFFRFIKIAHQATSIFGKFLVIGLGFPIIFQAFINMGVAVELFPTTGQTLPLISSGGTAIWMTCIAVGIILSVSKKEDEVKLDLEEKLQREEALQRIIDREIALEITNSTHEKVD